MAEPAYARQEQQKTTQQKGFFERWTAPAKRSSDCPDVEKLLDWIDNGNDEELTKHVDACKDCKDIMKLVEGSSAMPEENLKRFMLERQQAAQRALPVQQSSAWSDWFNYFLASPGRKFAGSVAAVAALLLITSVWWRKAEFITQKPPLQQVQIQPDYNGEVYASALKELNDSYMRLSQKAGAGQDARAEVPQLNQLLERIDRSKLSAQNKQQLEGLQARYQTMLFAKEGALKSPSDDRQRKDLRTEFYQLYSESRAQAAQPLVLSPDIAMKFQGGGIVLTDLASERQPSSQGAALSSVRAFRERSQEVANLPVQFESKQEQKQ